MVVTPALLAVGLLVGAVMGLAAARADRALDEGGAPADATVTDVVSRIVARDRTPDGSIRVRFAPADGRPREVAVDVGRAVGGFHQGDAVAILYDPRDPDQVRLVGVDPHRRGIPTLLLAGLGSALGVLALLAGRRRLAHRPGRPPRAVVAGRVAPRPGPPAARLPAGVPDPGSPRRAQRPAAGRAGGPRPPLDPTFAPEAWVAGLEGPTVVLAAPGGGHVLAVHRAMEVGSREPVRRRPLPVDIFYINN